MAFNFAPPFSKQNADSDIQEQLSGPYCASFSQPPPNSGPILHGMNFSIPPPPVPPMQRFPGWQQTHETPMHWNTARPDLTRPSLGRCDQENHPGIASGGQLVSCYPYTANTKLNSSGQFDGSTAVLNEPLKQKVQDELWLKNWLSRHRSNTTIHPTVKETSKAIKVFQARQILKNCFSLLQKLEKSHQELLAYKDSITTQNWQEKWNHVEDLQKQVANALSHLSNADNMTALKKTLVKRRKKRLAQKRRKKLYQQNQKKNLAKRQELHDKINAWLKNMEDVVEKAKREESLKHEADLVLGEVTRKKAEARRQISLLAALLKLRQIRAQSFASRGQPVSADSSARFIKVVEHLQQLWEDQLRGYNVEEQGLRVMLEEAVEERTKSYDKQAVAEWDRVLFGTKSVKFRGFYLSAESSSEAFVAVRKSWDKYLAPPDAVMTSAIPIGWVLPTNPSSSSWEKHLKPHY